MITGHCTSGVAGMHAKCSDPLRCSCSCHGNTPPAPKEIVPVTYACDRCDQTFPTPQGLGAHRRLNPTHRLDHQPAPTAAPEPAVVELEDDGPTSTLYAISGWHGGLHIDLTVDTGAELIDPTILRGVIALASALTEP